MKAATLATVAVTCVTRAPELNKEDNGELSPKKMEKAHQVIARAGLPPMKQQKPAELFDKKPNLF